MTEARRSYDWAGAIRELRRLPNRWLLAFPNVPARTEKTVRLRRNPELRLADGVLDAQLRNVYVMDDGSKRGDLFLRFVPNDHT